MCREGRESCARLRYDGQLASEGVQAYFGDVHAVQQHSAGGHIDQPEQRQHERRLAAPGTAHHSTAGATLQQYESSIARTAADSAVTLGVTILPLQIKTCPFTAVYHKCSSYQPGALLPLYSEDQQM